MADWTYDIGPYRISAELNDTKGPSVTLDADHSGIEVDCEQGSGYMREAMSFHIPIEVIRKLLAAQDAKAVPQLLVPLSPEELAKVPSLTPEAIQAALQAGKEARQRAEDELRGIVRPECSPGKVPRTCSWYDTDYDDATDPAPMPKSCHQPATHYSCCYDLTPCKNVCQEHSCRCEHE